MFRMISIFFLLVISVACQDREALDAGPSTLHLRLPSSLANHASRYQRFIERIETIDLRLAYTDGSQETLSFSASEIEGLLLPTVKDENPLKKIRVLVWDRTRDGELRGYPVLEGVKRVSTLASGGFVFIPLSLKISPREYDS